MGRSLPAGLIVCLLLLPAGSASGSYNGYEALSDWDALPLAKLGVTPGLASSYDRAGANIDYNHYESPTGFQSGDLDPVTVATIDGPGVITRFWMPHACARSAFKVKLTIDGQLLIDTTSDQVLGGSYGYMASPLVSTLVGGQVSYEPIVFSQSLKIESNNFDTSGGYEKRNYYQYTYSKLPAGSTVTPYSGALTPEQQQARNKVVDMINNVGSDPAPAGGSPVVLGQGPATIAAGASLALADVTGSGTVKRLNVKMAGASDDDLDGLRIRVRYDDHAGNAIDVPVAHFFGAGHGRVAYSSLPLGTEGQDGFYCYWPMPYRQGVAVELYNSSGGEISIDSAAVEYEPGEVSPDAGYLHAAFNEVGPTTDPTYQLLRAAGRGHYVGNLLWVDRQAEGYAGRSILEGDDIVVVDVDGASPVTLYGTGLEDAYNGGFYYNHVLEQSGEPPNPYSGIEPYHGLLRMNFPEAGSPDLYAHTDQYRWLIGDPVAFTDGIEVLMEQYLNTYPSSFGSTAFYYILFDPAGLGDANQDGIVDGQDFTFLKANYGLLGGWAAGDFNRDGIVDGQDFTILKAHFGEIGAPGETVPEPATLVLLAGSWAMLLKIRRKPRRRPPDFRRTG